MKQDFKTDNDWKSLLQKRLQLLQYVDDSGGLVGFSGDSSTSTEDLFASGVDATAYETPVTLDSSFGVTASANPSLASPLNNLSQTGGAALNTVSANPTIYSSGSRGVASQISSLSNTIGQWGFSIASLIGGGSPPPASMGIRYSSQPVTNNNSKLLMLGLLVVAVILIVSYED